jgi:hypothetical protein
MRFPLLPIFALCMLAASCTDPALLPQGESRTTSSDLSSVKIPVLRSPYCEKNWGAPEIQVEEDGGYFLRYRQGTSLNYVFIYGLVKPEPVPATPPDWKEESFNDATGFPTIIPHKQSWRETTILGKPVKWYQNDSGGGADFPCYKTVDFSLTAPDGRIGHYRVSVCSDTEAKAADWIKRVDW